MPRRSCRGRRSSSSNRLSPSWLPKPSSSARGCRPINVTYAKTDGAYVLAEEKDKGSRTRPRRTARSGDFETAFADAPVKIDVTYTTPDQSQSMMEPHASIAEWHGDKLTVHTSHQIDALGANRHCRFARL